MRIFGIPSVPLLLTLAGLAPFIAAASVVAAAGEDVILKAQAGLVLAVYAGIMLGFVGGVRWGAEINAQGSGIPRTPIINLSVLGALAGTGLVVWAVLGGLGWPVFAAAALAHLAHAAWDIDGAGLPNWFRRLRVIAGAGAAASLAGAAVAYAVL